MPQTHIAAANILIDLVSTFEPHERTGATQLALKTAMDSLINMNAVEISSGKEENEIVIDLTQMILAATVPITFLSAEIARLRQVDEETVLFELREHLDRLER